MKPLLNISTCFKSFFLAVTCSTGFCRKHGLFFSRSTNQTDQSTGDPEAHLSHKLTPARFAYSFPCSAGIRRSRLKTANWEAVGHGDVGSQVCSSPSSSHVLQVSWSPGSPPERRAGFPACALTPGQKHPRAPRPTDLLHGKDGPPGGKLSSWNHINGNREKHQPLNWCTHKSVIRNLKVLKMDGWAAAAQSHQGGGWQSRSAVAASRRLPWKPKGQWKRCS